MNHLALSIIKCNNDFLFCYISPFSGIVAENFFQPHLRSPLKLPGS